MKWYYADGGKQVGPVEESALDDLVRQGIVRDDTLVWREGMAAWQRHGVARGSSSPNPPMPPVASFPATSPARSSASYGAASGAASGPGADIRYCSECGRGVPANQLTSYGDQSVCTQCQPAYADRLRGGTRHFGGFWIRFGAIIIDGIILFVISAIITFPFGLAMGGASLGLGRNPDPGQVMAVLPAIMGMVGLSFLIRMALSLAYETYFLTTKGATPGKMALGLKVTTAAGGPIPVGLAVGRYFAKYLSGLILCIGFLIAAFDREKRSLHDHICGTRVVYTR